MDDALKSALYLNASQRTITYKHKTQTITESFWQQNFVSVLYPFWDSDRDKLEVFSYSSTGQVLVVKNKYIKNFKTGEFYWSSYQFPVEEIPSKDVDALYEKLIELYILFVSSNNNIYNDKLKAAYIGQSVVNWNKVRILRKFMLDESDWTLLPDSIISDEEKEMWKLYRNTLRNIPQEQAGSNPYNIYFPISPDIYKKRGYKQTYLSKEVDSETKEYQYYQLTNNNLENYTQKILNYIAVSVSTFPLEDKDIHVVSAPENTLEEIIKFIEENHMSTDWEEPQAIDSEGI